MRREVLKNSARGGRIRVTPGLGVGLAVGPGRAGGERLHPERRRLRRRSGAVSRFAAFHRAPGSHFAAFDVRRDSRCSWLPGGLRRRRWLRSAASAATRPDTRPVRRSGFPSERVDERAFDFASGPRLRGSFSSLSRFSSSRRRSSSSFSDMPATGALQVQSSLAAFAALQRYARHFHEASARTGASRRS